MNDTCYSLDIEVLFSANLSEILQGMYKQWHGCNTYTIIDSSPITAIVKLPKNFFLVACSVADGFECQ